jgi:hypothetical protein
MKQNILIQPKFKQALKSWEASDFVTCKEIIIWFELAQTIIFAQQILQSKLIRQSLQYDELVKEAVSIIDDMIRFRSILTNKSAHDLNHDIILVYYIINGKVCFRCSSSPTDVFRA